MRSRVQVNARTESSEWEEARSAQKDLAESRGRVVLEEFGREVEQEALLRAVHLLPGMPRAAIAVRRALRPARARHRRRAIRLLLGARAHVLRQHALLADDFAEVLLLRGRTAHALPHVEHSVLDRLRYSSRHRPVVHIEQQPARRRTCASSVRSHRPELVSYVLLRHDTSDELCARTERSGAGGE